MLCLSSNLLRRQTKLGPVVAASTSLSNTGTHSAAGNWCQAAMAATLMPLVHAPHPIASA